MTRSSIFPRTDAFASGPVSLLPHFGVILAEFELPVTLRQRPWSHLWKSLSVLVTAGACRPASSPPPDRLFCGSCDRIIEEGDIVFFDTGSRPSTVNSLRHFDRIHAVVLLQTKCVAPMRPCGLATEAGICLLRSRARRGRCVRKHGQDHPDVASLGNNVCRLCHGLGIQLTSRRPACRATERCSRRTWWSTIGPASIRAWKNDRA